MTKRNTKLSNHHAPPKRCVRRSRWDKYGELILNHLEGKKLTTQEINQQLDLGDPNNTVTILKAIQHHLTINRDSRRLKAEMPKKGAWLWRVDRVKRPVF